MEGSKSRMGMGPNTVPCWDGEGSSGLWEEVKTGRIKANMLKLPMEKGRMALGG